MRDPLSVNFDMELNIICNKIPYFETLGLERISIPFRYDGISIHNFM
jgi:hypothetical protein